MPDDLGFSRLDADTIARLATATMRELNTKTVAQTPESEIASRTWQNAFDDGLDRTGILEHIIQRVEVGTRDMSPKEQLHLMLGIAVRFGARLQRTIEAFERTPRPDHLTEPILANPNKKGTDV